jgi:hypothetical protein
MAWTAPRTWIAGEVVTASLMNTHVRDNFKAICYLHDTTVVNYATGGSTINYGVTFTAAPDPVPVVGDTSAGAVFAIPIASSNTTTSFKVKLYDAAGVEIAALTAVRINWIAVGTYT